ncbi:hypothetical protein N0B44_11555 [Roseibacterium beibuensis]|uniref:Tetratricopeptide repeat protein n=1 Tax=[Roseibacterium] beibuensis TaxID=1193142 RepID=A0ABP9LIP0_9RHOB|nr:hypothetical protein [Roseibacterium beibuensis]MCS6623551.1 hypothetical protein [Roseibacterium beibuensis]
MRPSSEGATPDLPTLLAGAAAARSRPAESAAAIARALAVAPHEPEVRLAAYRFYFHAHDYPAARAQAEALLAHYARRLNVAADWADVSPDDAPFTTHAFAPGLYLQTQIGLGYCAARSGDLATARAALSKAAALDPTDRFGGAWLRDKIDRADEDADG